MDSLETFEMILNSLEKYPNMRFMLFCSSWGVLEQELESFCRQNGHSLLVYQTKELDIMKKSLTSIKIKDYSPKQQRYNLQGRLYNYIFIHELPETLDNFLKKIYSSVANGGRVYLFSSKSIDIWRVMESFENQNYVSISKIELDNSTLYISGKKMHGWGN
jgi:hypothetical protein